MVLHVTLRNFFLFIGMKIGLFYSVYLDLQYITGKVS